MKQIRRVVLAAFYSLPVQLLVIQIRKYKLLLIFWFLLLSILSGGFGSSLGLSYLFLEPEYLGQESFWSLLLVGCTLGTFIFAYMITIYINESYRFHFIALRSHPFLNFSFNNFLLPGLLLGIYLYRFTDFHISTCGGFTWEVVEKLSGLVFGMLLTLLLFASYFFATGKRSIFRTLGDGLERELEKTQGKRNKRIIISKAKASFRDQGMVRHYLRFPFRVEDVHEKPVDFRKLVQALNKNHGNLLLIQIVIFVMIAILGLLEAHPYFQIPAGASLLLVFSLMLMMAGAITFWFRKLGILPLVVLGAFLYLYDNVSFFNEQHHAIGMNYESTPAPYNKSHLDAIASEANYLEDKAATLEMLNKWKSNYQQKYGAHMQPKAVFISSSGGGLRSSFWNLLVLQQLDSLTDGIFTDNIRLFSGASGGMFGTAYFRELYVRRQQGEILLSERKNTSTIFRKTCSIGSLSGCLPTYSSPTQRFRWVPSRMTGSEATPSISILKKICPSLKAKGSGIMPGWSEMDSSRNWF